MQSSESFKKIENQDSDSLGDNIKYVPFKKRKLIVNSCKLDKNGIAEKNSQSRGQKWHYVLLKEDVQHKESFKEGEKGSGEGEEGFTTRKGKSEGEPRLLKSDNLSSHLFNELEEQEKNIIDDVTNSINLSLVSVKQRSQGIVYDKPIETIYTLPSKYKNVSNTVLKVIRDVLFIDVSGSDVPAPIAKFEHMKLPKPILRALNDKNIYEPTKIQMQGLPAALLGRDVIGISSTGSGKTLVFVIPMIMQSWEMELRLPLKAFEGPFGLVVCPSRELASQIAEIVNYFTRYVRKHGGPHLDCLCVIGGTNLMEQKDALRDGVHMVVATPGRLSDLISKRTLNLTQCRFICFDEADRLIDLGFEEEISNVFNHLTGRHQTLLFSATMPKKLQEFARASLVMPIIVNVGVSGSASRNIKQLILRVPKEQKLKRILESLQNTPPPVLIFCENKADVDMVHEYLLLKGVDVSAIHGGLSQEERSSSVKKFRDGEKDVLVGTDVASKGLDFSSVQHVINFDLPRDIENYVHRIGRTGRGTKTGLATTLLDGSEEESVLKNLKSILIESNQEIPEFLRSIHVSADTLKEIGGLRGCAFCGALGHRIGECQKLGNERSKQLMGPRDDEFD